MSHGDEVRFGSKGSKSVDKEKGVWTDHETNESGGFVDLCKIAYPEANGHLADFLETRFGMDKDPQFTPKQRDKITTYDYIGDHGVLVYQVVRTDFADGKKTFRQQRPDGFWAEEPLPSDPKKPIPVPTKEESTYMILTALKTYGFLDALRR